MTRLAWFAVAALAAPLATAQSGPAIVPVEAASYHVPVFSNDYVIVLNVFIPPGRESGYHRHSLDLVAVLMSDTARTNQTPGGEPIARPAVARGTVTFTPYAREPLVHTVALQGEAPFHNLVVELQPTAPGRFTVSSRGEGYTQLVDNERVRVWRLVLEPGQTAPAITQSAPGVRIVVDGGELVELVPGQPERAKAPHSGEFFWQDAGTTRAVRNIGTTRLDLVELELK